MALSSTIYIFDIRLSDGDRQVYETLSLRVARHPSETAEYLLTRVLAYCREFTEGIAFSSGGLSDPDEPTLSVRDLTGALRTWIEIGAPDAARLHKASKSAARVAVYSHKDVASWMGNLAGERIHRAGSIEVYAVDRAWLAAFAAKLERRMAFDLAIAEGTIYATLGEETLTGKIERYEITNAKE
ncbi:MAG TPA: YaeQ family protein [bacterium]|nr:YaeQ family protein [bacterium]